MGELIFFLCCDIFFTAMFFYGIFNTTVYLGDTVVIWYPAVILALIVIFLGIHTVRVFKKLTPEQKRLNVLDIFRLRDKRMWMALLTITGTFLYAYLLEIAGFIIMTFLVCIFYMFMLGERKLLKAALISLAVLIPVYCIFVYGLDVRLPRGLGAFRDFSLFVEYLL